MAYIVTDKPLHTHDGTCCKFLGRDDKLDLYVCLKNPWVTFIARWGSEGHEYYSSNPPGDIVGSTSYLYKAAGWYHRVIHRSLESNLLKGETVQEINRFYQEAEQMYGVHPTWWGRLGAEDRMCDKFHTYSSPPVETPRMKIAALLQRGDRLPGHGSYIRDYQWQGEAVWVQQMQVTDDVARTMIAEAMVGEGPDPYNGNLDAKGKEKSPVKVEWWMLPENKSFVVFQEDGTFVWAIYRHDWKTYVVRAEGKKLLARLRQHNVPNTPFFKTIEALFG